jgi:hypothetical protein
MPRAPQPYATRCTLVHVYASVKLITLPPSCLHLTEEYCHPFTPLLQVPLQPLPTRSARICPSIPSPRFRFGGWLLRSNTGFVPDKTKTECVTDPLFRGKPEVSGLHLSGAYKYILLYGQLVLHQLHGRVTMGSHGLTCGMGRICMIANPQLAVLMLPYFVPAPIYANVHSRDLVKARDLPHKADDRHRNAPLVDATTW